VDARGLRRIGFDQLADQGQGVEQEVRLDLRLQAAMRASTTRRSMLSSSACDSALRASSSALRLPPASTFRPATAG
jgi:hypothetical protein